jgi:hypothetical protein
MKIITVRLLEYENFVEIGVRCCSSLPLTVAVTGVQYT